MSLLFQRLARELDVSVRAAIFRTMGELLKIDNIMLRPILKRYNRRLEEAGTLLARGEDIPSDLLEKINNPLIPETMYRKLANEHWPRQ